MCKIINWRSVRFAVCVKTNKFSRKQRIFINTFQFFSTPTCFGIWLPSSGGHASLTCYSSNVLCYGRVWIMTRPVWSVVVEWSHRTGHSPHTPLTQKIAWVAYQTLTTPWRWQPCAETCRGRKNSNVLIKHPLLHWPFVGIFTNADTR
jgi:hypothetical protein